jgi:hypothetical protein
MNITQDQLDDKIQESITGKRIDAIKAFFSQRGYIVDHSLIEIIYTAVIALKELNNPDKQD